MDENTYPKSGIPIRRTIDLLPQIFKTETNDKFLSGSLDAWTQPGTLEKTVGYIGRRYGKTYRGTDIYLDDDETLRSRYQLEPAAVVKHNEKITNFYDYIDFKNQLRFFGNEIERDDLITDQDHYTWDPPIEWDKFVNYREYYWMPDGPPPVKILGQSQEIVSTYKVSLGTGSVFIFTPDGLKNNPTITLFRGQTYKFLVNAPDNGFVLRTAYDTGSLLYNPEFSYSRNQMVVFDGKLWRAKKDIPFTEGSTITEESEDWEYLEPAAQASALDYNKGVTNNGLIQGTLTFEVPLDAPDVLFYQSFTDPNRFGRFLIADIESNTKIDLVNEVIGKTNYTSSNDVTLSNGMVVYFLGQVTPEKYAEDTWVVEGVGEEIKLVRFQDLIPPRMSDGLPEVLFDNEGFDTQPFDDATSYPDTKDYITINRSSEDSNGWSRYNRWFHRSVLDFSYRFNNSEFDLSDLARAKRPIIEFKKNLKLVNHGTKAKPVVDYIDNFTDDVFSIIEGSQGYIVDGEELYEGARVLFTADTDSLVKNNVYKVTFINHSSAAASFKDEWSTLGTYRAGETIRYNGQSYFSVTEAKPFLFEVLSTRESTRTFRTTKNQDIKVDLAITFSGQTFGSIDPDVVYYIISVDNSSENFTEFKISTQKKGFEFKPTTSASGLGKMIAHMAVHPTDTNVWRPATPGRQISLRKVDDTEPVIGDSLLVRRGLKNRGAMYHFDGEVWAKSQQKVKVNQSPLFDVFDDNGVSFSDQESYPVTSFVGSKILSYKESSSVVDNELGFGISYLNIDNVGDILFNFDWDTEIFTWKEENTKNAKKVSTGYYLFSDKGNYGNSWTKSDNRFYQPIIDSVVLDESSDTIDIRPIAWRQTPVENIYKTLLYINGQRYTGEYSRQDSLFVFPSVFEKGTVITIKVYADAIPDQGYYEIPQGLEKNPLNQEITSFTLGQAIDHVETALDLFDDFQGSYPGPSNLRDISGYQILGRRFAKHSGITPLALLLLCDKQTNIIKSLEFASSSYASFKNSFMQIAETMDYGQNPVNAVDEIITSMSKTKVTTNAFVDSDMVGAGAFKKISYVVEDEGIKVFSLSERFDLTGPSRRAVYVYHNGLQLLVSKDYVFNSNFGFVELLIELAEGDRIEIREYASSALSFIPPTPTKLGLYKKYTPRIFLDDSFLTPVQMIQGHDGSLIRAYGDYRDEIILELEKRIYNNIKSEYTTAFFDIDKIFGGYYGSSIFDKFEFESIVARYFRKWAVVSRTDYAENPYFDSEDPFTYTYSKMTDTSGQYPLPAWWRGIYRWFFDTDRPHIVPWEMLGFSEKPVWWDKRYGLPPYTKNNLVLWEDIKDGIIREGPRAGRYARYARPEILDYIPVDVNGNLENPLDAGLVANFSLINARGGFTFGDVGPVESVWRTSSEYPFAVIIACCLARPFEFIIENFDKNNIKVNLIGQTVNVSTGLFSKIEDIVFPDIDGPQTSGLVNYLADYYRGLSLALDGMKEKILGLDVNLSSRLSGFVDKSQQKYILDSKNPRSMTGNVFIPEENYQLIFNAGVPFRTVTYGGVIVEKVETGYKIFGYDNLDPIFRYYPIFRSQGDPILSVGGVSENFLDWEPGGTYTNGTIVRLGETFYRALKSHSDIATFDPTLWKKLPALPLKGSVEAFRRLNIDRSQVLSVEYGTIFSELQLLVDFLYGYEGYLEDQGFSFNDYDAEIGEPKNWTTSVKELMFWTRHSWSVGSLIALSPSSQKLTLNTPVGVPESLLDGFYDYQVMQNDGTVLPIEGLNVNRKFQQVTVEAADERFSIFLFKAYLVLKEHVTVFNDRTVFNDVLYEKTTGYRQERVKSRGFRTVDWDGDYTSPGFIYDNVNIEPWQPFVDYRLGDIVSYLSYNWTSLRNQRGVEVFNESTWTKLDSTPKQELIPNFDYRISQIDDFYDLDADGTGSSQRDLARHAVGYQQREYLQGLSDDQVTQFKIYQGFIREKGTFNSVKKVFDKLSNSNTDSVTLKEEWAFRVGQLGGVDQTRQIEFIIEKDNFELNPQPLLIVQGNIPDTTADKYYRVNQSSFNYGPIPFTSHLTSKILYNGISRSAGYVKPIDADLVVKTRDDLLNEDINLLANNSHIWVTFDNDSWNMLRLEFTNSLVIRKVEIEEDLAKVTLNRKHKFSVGDIVGIKDIENLTGFFKISKITTNSFSVQIDDPKAEIGFNPKVISYNLYILSQARFVNYQGIDQRYAALLKDGSKLWVDDGYSDSDKWQVVQKKIQFKEKVIKDYMVTDPRGIGSSVVYGDSIKQSMFGMPGSGYVLSASEFSDRLEVRQIVVPAAGYNQYVNHSFGEALAISPDDKWLAVGSPRASGVRSRYKGNFEPNENYRFGDIVHYQGKLWESVLSQNGDGSTINIYSDSWKPADIILGNSLGVPGPTNQGMISMYKWAGNQWNVSDIILSPRMSPDELFGSKISIAVSGSKYYMSVSALGALNSTGRVYLFVYENNRWRIIEDQNYRGLFDNSLVSGKAILYPAGSIVWFESRLWEAVEDYYTDGSVLTQMPNSWQLKTSISAQSMLPSTVAAPDDGSTLGLGLVDDSTLLPGAEDATQIVAMVKQGDHFGNTLAMSRDGSILAIGIPNGDNQYFENYRGIWNSYQEYHEGDVVRYHDEDTGISSYKKLTDPRAPDSDQTDSTNIYVSLGEHPSSAPWIQVGSDSTAVPTGKVFIYKRNPQDAYKLVQTITSTNLEMLNDTPVSESIASGDQLGFSLDLDASGQTLTVSSPNADINFISQGSVYVFKLGSQLRASDIKQGRKYKILTAGSSDFKKLGAEFGSEGNIFTASRDGTLDDGSGMVSDEFYVLKQKLQSFEEYPNELFGSSVSISQRGERIAVGAKNARFKATATFDGGSVTFDEDRTRFFEDRGYPGQVYVYEKKDQTYFLTEKLDTDLQDFESFGSHIDISESAILVGSPDFKKVIKSTDFEPGETYTIKTVGNTNWRNAGVPTDVRVEPDVLFTAIGPTEGTGTAVSTTKVGMVRLFRKQPGKNSWNVVSEQEDQVDLDKINNIVVYDDVNNINLGVVDIVDHYRLKILGVAEQELSYKTLYDPAVYTRGTANQEVDEGQAWFEDQVGQLWWDLSTVKFVYHEQGDISFRLGHWNQQVPYSQVDIYEWVESTHLPSKWSKLADTVEGLALGISGQPKFADDTVMCVKEFYNSLTGEVNGTKYYYWVKNKTVIPQNVSGRRTSATGVRDLINQPQTSNLPFVAVVDSDKFILWNFRSLLKSDRCLINIEYNKGSYKLNPVHNEYQLLTEGVADSVPTEALETKWLDSLIGYDLAGNKVPDVNLPAKQRYGISFRPRQSMFVDRFKVLEAVLENINSVLRSRSFAETINLNNLLSVDSEPTNIRREYDQVVDIALDLQNVGTTRVKRPLLRPVIINGVIDNIEIVDPGFGYRVVPVIEIEGDGTGAEAEATIDAQGRIKSVKITAQGRKYSSAIVKIRNFSVLVRQDETANGFWSIYAWDDVRKVFIKSKLQSYDTSRYWEYIDWYAVGYSSNTSIVTEIDNFYQEPEIYIEVGDVIRVKEFGAGGWVLLEKTLSGEGSFSDDYVIVGRKNGTIRIKTELFLPTAGQGFDASDTFDSDFYDINPTLELRKILTAVKEDIFLDDLKVEWNKLFFTSVRYAFVQNSFVDWAFKTSFLNAIHKIGDLDQRISYKSDNLESYQKYLEEVKPYRTTIREFTSTYGSIDLFNSVTTDFDSPPAYSAASGKILPVGREYDRFDEYPWKWWVDNQGYSVLSIEVSNPGSNYSDPPNVLIEGSGVGATARAFVSNGIVTGIEVLTIGSGYLSAPTVTLVGGNGTSQDIAKAVAIIGDGKIRSMLAKIKFDRLSKEGRYYNFTQSETFTALGFTSAFELSYAPTRDRRKISVKKNGQVVLSDEYNITLYQTNIDGFTALKGRLIFINNLNAGDVIEVLYDKNEDYLDAVNRIEKYYSPTTGMIGKEVPQLMTGIDFGGVQIQGTTFDVTGGWDALPWFTDNWDSVETSADHYYLASGDVDFVELPRTPSNGEMISVYIKRRAVNGVESNPVRIDDVNYTPNWDSSQATNPAAQMPTFVGDGSTKIVSLIDPSINRPYISLDEGDILIFRPFDSDGAVSINDPNIIDTRLSGGTLSAMEGAYVTATGRAAEDIVVDGSRFISPEQVPAPEENIPGQVLESVAIKVYHVTPSGSAPIQNSVFVADGETRVFDIGLRILDIQSLLVYVDRTRVEFEDSTTGYEIDFVDNTIRFISLPAAGSVIEIISVGIGGIALLDYQEFVADGETDLFLTRAVYDQTNSVIVTVDGITVDSTFFNSTDYTDTENRALIQLGITPRFRQTVKVVCLGPSLLTDSEVSQALIRANRQVIPYDGSSKVLDLDTFVSLSRASAISSVLVDVNGRHLRGPDTRYVVYDGNNNAIKIGIDPLFNPGTITFRDLEVYINDIIQPEITVYTFNVAANVITVNKEYLQIGDEIRVLINLFNEYEIRGNSLIIDPSILNTLKVDDKIEVVWFDEYPTLGIINDRFSGGKLSYKLNRAPVDSSYVWVYLNGQRLTKEQDYSVDVARSMVFLKNKTLNTDEIFIVEFGRDFWDYPSSYEIFKDMLNINHYKRYTRGTVSLAKPLYYYDKEIHITDASEIFDPIVENNVPGVLLINNERIEYFRKSGNVISQLRRGSLGTAIPEIHEEKSLIADMGPAESIPYTDKQEKWHFVSDGSGLVFGPLDFVPEKSNRNFYRETQEEEFVENNQTLTRVFYTSIPEEYGACDQIEVFAGGKRLRKDSMNIYDETLGADSPSADKISEAEFSVDGETAFVRLTTAVPAGTRITIVRRVGRTWYDKGAMTASSGQTLSKSSNPIVSHIFQKTTIIPE